MPAPRFGRPFYHHHIFNPWHGCMKIAPGCVNCWAEQWTDARLFGKNVGRKLAPQPVWLAPAQWNAKAAQQRWRRNVFCMSTGDLFEDRRDLDEPRSRVLDIIAECEWLDFWIFTRRPGLIETLAPPGRRMTWQKNVFLGISIEDQAHADKLIPALFKTSAAGYHVSCIPLLGPINLRPYLNKLCFVKTGLESLRAMRRGEDGVWRAPDGRHPRHPDGFTAWHTDIVRQCAEAGTYFQPYNQHPRKEDLPPGMTSYHLA